MTWTVTADPDRFDEAIEWFRKRTVITADAAATLDARAKQEAFWVGGGLQLEQVQRVFDKAAKSIEEGTPFEEFRKAVRTELSDPAHVETVFRNAAQRAYNAGRFEQMTEPSVIKFRPFWLFDAVLDSRTTQVCNTRDGTLLPAEDAWWQANVPPLHHRCRSSIRNIRKTEADRRGGVKQPPPGDPPDGWGAAPGKAPPPQPKGKDRGLTKALEAKQKTTKPRKPKTPAEHTVDHWEAYYSKQYGAAAKAVGWGRASLERGLDMPLPELRAHLKRLNSLGHVRAGMDRIDDLALLHGRKATLRECGAELDDRLRVMAAMGGHLERVGRAALKVPDLELEQRGRDALKFFSEMTHPSVIHPTSWNFEKISGRAYCSANRRKIAWTGTPGVLEHEWGHALEALNPTLEARAQAFLKARTAGETPKKLKAIQPWAGYDPSEIAKEDAFVDAYMGKIYAKADGSLYATEVTSMGTELLSARRRGWGDLETLPSKDPELLYFALGQLAHP